MIYNWNEVSQPMFKEIFDTFWDGKHPNKILEVQNLTGIYSKFPSLRVFFGERINILDWKEYNKDSYNIIKTVADLKEVQKESKLSMCITESGPKITPLGAAPEHYDIIMKTCFGFPGDSHNLYSSIKPMSAWFTKSLDGNYCCDLDADPKVTPEEMFLRIRAIDFDDWKQEIDLYNSTGHFSKELTKEDISREYISVNFPEIK